jgi:hypothetical protein
MRAKVVAAKATVLVHGPGKFLIRNKTNTAAVFLEVGNYPPPGLGEVAPLATEASGFEEPKGATAGFLLEIGLGPEEALSCIVKAAEAEQELEILRTSPKF